MTERERLIELIGNIEYGEHTFKDVYVKSFIEKVADYLLANGAIVPDEKIGDNNV